MKKQLLTVLLASLAGLSAAREKQKQAQLNLGFEEKAGELPQSWNIFGTLGYRVYLDSGNKQEGRYAAVIEHIENDSVNFKALAFALPHNYEGQQITLSGYIKTENVSEGFAGLWMRIDPQVAFDNMQSRGITGTTGWKKYEITLHMQPQKTKQIIVGGLLSGKGKMWLDNLQVSIDGKDISTLPAFARTVPPAEKDTAFDQGSGIVFPSLNKEQCNNLALLGRIWGFMKYYHPAVGKGNYNWDYELFRMLPGYLAVNSTAQRDQVLAKWIGSYGAAPPCTTCKESTDTAAQKPDLSWINRSNMALTLKKELEHIYRNRYQGSHYYIATFPHVGNPEFKNENPYTSMPYPDAGFRLLALYKYWNMIEYFFPYKHLTEKDWASVLPEYLPGIISAKDELAYELVMLRLIAEVGDSHANLWGGGDKISAYRGDYYAPFRVTFVENKLVVTDIYNPELIPAASIRIGDVITHINGQDIRRIADSLRPYYPASNEAARLRDIAFNLLRSGEKSIQISYRSEGKALDKTISLYPQNDLKMYGWYKVDTTQKCYRLLNEKTGYITLASIRENDIDSIKKELAHTDGIIIDIRNYPSTFVPFSLGAFFVSHNAPFVRFTRANLDNPGEFDYGTALEIPKGRQTYKGKVIVLVNEYSQSQAEYTAMAFRAGANTTIIGSTTAGADGNVSYISLPGNLRTMISGIGVYYPDGTETQRKGIIPDITIRPTIAGIRAGKDEVLEKAIALISQ